MTYAYLFASSIGAMVNTMETMADSVQDNTNFITMHLTAGPDPKNDGGIHVYW